MGKESKSNEKAIKKRFQPAPGRDFEIDSAPSIEARTKGFFVRTVVLASLCALAVTGAYGLLYHTYGPVQSTWVVVGPIMGAMINHYFGGHRKDSG
jgi:nitrate reductase NapE component